MNQEPRPAFISVGELFGGVERHLLGMCTWMQRQGREPLLILFFDRELARQAREIGVNPIILESSGSFDWRVPRRLADILTPIVKGWSTEVGTQLTSLGVQVHGGMGFIEETGAAQYYRDVRITPIYEGTT